MFPDVELVRTIQVELDEVIQNGVGNIVQLLRNADSGTSSSAARILDEGDFAAKQKSRNVHRKWDHSMNAKGKPMYSERLPARKLSSILVQDGLVTDKMIRDLKREWAGEEKRKRKK